MAKSIYVQNTMVQFESTTGRVYTIPIAALMVAKTEMGFAAYFAITTTWLCDISATEYASLMNILGFGFHP